MNLLPCPFCGSPAELNKDCDYVGDFYRVFCTRCGIETGYEDTASNARDTWNRRTPAENMS